MLKIIGRKDECAELEELLAGHRPQFVAVYGRRRVGKTYLIKRFFNERFSFYVTGVKLDTPRQRLKRFAKSLAEAGDPKKSAPKNWEEAFTRLKETLSRPDVYREPTGGKRVIFIDELPWIAGKRKSFLAALDAFWNGYGESQEDLILIVCGSATSWIIGNIVDDRGGFHNRITKQLRIMPFGIGDCKVLLEDNGVSFSDSELLEAYMVFGGIPYYLNLLSPRFSLAQNIERLCFSESGELRYEYDRVLKSLFDNSAYHGLILKEMHAHPEGILRKDLALAKGIGNGSQLTIALDELEQCGFICPFKNFKKKKYGPSYRIIDPFVLFSLSYLGTHKVSSWLNFISTPGYYSYLGRAFEIVCLNHIPEIKKSLGISGLSTEEGAFRNAACQIDLLISRKDGVVNLCEMKYGKTPYEIDGEYEEKLLGKAEAFREATKSKAALRITMVTAYGIKDNKHSHCVSDQVNFVQDIINA